MTRKKITWPTDGSPLRFENIADPCIAAMRFAYKMARINEDRTVPWPGPTLGQSELVCSIAPNERLRAEALEYENKDQGRDALEVIISIAVQLGIEQGRRIEKERSAVSIDLIDTLLGHAIGILKNVADRSGGAQRKKA